jgi:hypothetical protein
MRAKHAARITPWQTGAVVCLLAALGLSGSGCRRLQARTTPEPPALDVPAPPPRPVEVAEGEVLPPGALVEEQLPNIPARPRPPAAQQSRPGGKPEPKAEAVVAEPAPELPRVPPATTLQTAPASQEAEFEKTIRDLLARAASNLGRVDYQRLNSDARSQYDQAKRFSTQAEEALGNKNLLFAHNLADKADTLAAQLAGR